MAKLLRDSIPHNYVAETQLVEGAQKEPGILARVKGVFSAYDTENKNGRVYEKNLWAQQLETKDVQDRIKNRLCLGEADHPETRTESVIKEASHTITEMYDDGKEFEKDKTDYLIDHSFSIWKCTWYLKNLMESSGSC